MMRGARRRHNGLLAVAILLVIAGLVAVTVGGCGGSTATEQSTTTTAASSASPSTGQPAGDGEGVLVAKEILSTFDELVGKVAELAKDKPEPATLKPQLEELYASYLPIMTELNGEYLALRDSDTVQWGACNTYLGDNRGKHVTEKDNTLTPALQYYNLELGDQETVDLLSKKPVELLEVAVKQN